MASPYPKNTATVTILATTGDAKVAEVTDDKVNIAAAGASIKIHESDRRMLKKGKLIA
jgi:hypothetical protein